jgi:hypothetical protein
MDRLWIGDPPPSGPSQVQVEKDLKYWRPAAVVAVTGLRSPLGHYLTGLFGPPSIRTGQVIAWRLATGSAELAGRDSRQARVPAGTATGILGSRSDQLVRYPAVTGSASPGM